MRTGRSHDGGRSRKVLLQLQKPTYFVDEPSEPRRTSTFTSGVSFAATARLTRVQTRIGDVAATTRGTYSIRVPSVNRTMSERLRLADLLSGLSIVSDLAYGLPIETALRSCLIGTAVARRMALPEREVADVFYVSLLFHVGCVAYAQETFELFGDDQAVRRAAVETDHRSQRNHGRTFGSRSDTRSERT